jgi:hypothetical membrane protein
MRPRANKLQKIKVFTDKYPLLGPLIWMLSCQYFAAQFVVAHAWGPPGYSLTQNFISDLGNTACGAYAGGYVCSPDHAVINVSLILLGLTMAVGSLLIYQEFKESRWSIAGFVMMAVAGLGAALVGIFPENTIVQLHATGAFLAFFIGDLGMVFLSLGLTRVRQSFRIFTLCVGIISLIAFWLFVSSHHLGLGQGTMERLASYPQTLWIILFGLYMTGTHIRSRNLSGI